MKARSLAEALKDIADLEEELETALDHTDYWIAEVANRGKVVQEQAARIAKLEADRDEWMVEADLNLRTLIKSEADKLQVEIAWREDTADLGRFDDALHSAFDDFRVDFPDSSITDYDEWLALHVTCGKEMRAP